MAFGTFNTIGANPISTIIIKIIATIVAALSTVAITINNIISLGSRDWSSSIISPEGTVLVATETGGNIWVSSDSGTNWTEQNKIDNGYPWQYVSMNFDGTTICACSNNGNLWTSTNSGTDWRDSNITDIWKSVAVSSYNNGNIMYAVSSTGNFLYSTNYGYSWNTQPNNDNTWSGVTTNANGNISYSSDDGGNIYLNVLSENTITSTALSLGAHTWKGITTDSTGNVVVAISANGNVFVSTNSGSNWTNSFFGTNLSSVAINPLYPSTIYVSENPGSILYSTNSGLNWTRSPSYPVGAWNSISSSINQNGILTTVSGGNLYTQFNSNNNYDVYKILSPASSNWTSIASDASGIKLLVGDGTSNGNIWVSTNSGNNWTEVKQFGNGQSWSTCACSLNGNVMVAAASPNGNIWLSINSGTNWIDTEQNGNWSALSIDSDGAKIYATNNGGRVIYSNYGIFWGQYNNIANWSCSALSVNGSSTIITVGTQNPGNLYGDANEIYPIVEPINIWTKGVQINVNGGDSNYITSCTNESGNIIINTIYNGAINRSTNYGATWVNVGPGVSSYYGCSMNSKGDFIVVSSGDSQVYYSTSYGNIGTWNTYNIYSPLQGAAVNSIGNIAFVVASGITDGIWKSTDYGINWSQVDNIVRTYAGCAINSSGNIAIAISNQGIIRSIDGATNWITTSETTSFYSCAVSYIGNVVIAAPNLGTTGIWVSTDYASSFNRIVTTGYYTSCAINSTGKVAMAARTTTSRISYDYGATWNTIPSITSIIITCCINAAGNIGYAFDDSAFVYKGYYMITGSFNAISDVWIQTARISGNFTNLDTSCTNESGNIVIKIRSNIGGTTGTINKSTDYGVNWVNVAPSSKSYFGCAMNSIGNFIVVSDNSSTINFSTSYGNIGTWRTSSVITNNIGKVAVNSFGNIAIGVGSIQNIYRSTNYGPRWTAVDSTVRAYVGCAINSIGNIAIALTTTTNIVRSTNYSVTTPTWQTITTPTPFYSCAVNSIGNIGIAVTSAGTPGIWVSTNYFTSFNLIFTTGYYNSCAINSTGMIAIAGGNTISQISYNYGATWNTITTIPTPIITCCIGSRGNIAYAFDNTNIVYIRSIDLSSNLTSIGNLIILPGSPSGNWVSIATNTTGSIVIAASSPGNLYISTNSRTSWTTILVNDVVNRLWKSVACDSTGSIISALENPGNLWISTNTGVNWTYIENAPQLSWNSLVSNRSGNILLAVAGNNGNIYKIASTLIPDRPTNITINTAINDFTQSGNITVSWNPPNNTGGSAIQSYIVKINPDGMIKTVSGTNNSIIVTDLPANKQYSVSISSVNLYGLSKYISAIISLFAAIIVLSLYSVLNYNTGPISTNWGSIATDVSGINIIIVPNTPNGNIWLSTDSLNTSREIKQFGDGYAWTTCACSSNGNIMVAASSPNGNIWISTNTGGNWIDSSQNGNWSAIAMDSDGANIYVANNGGKITYSNNYGSIWTQYDTNGDWSCVSFAVNGFNTYITLGTQKYDNLYTSEAYQTTATILPGSPSGNWVSITTNTTGNIVIAASSPGNIYLSSDYRTSWSTILVNGVQNRLWKSVSCNTTGSVIGAAENPGNLWVSTNTGAYWNYISAAPSTAWNTIAPATNKSKNWLAVAGNGGNIFKVIYSIPDNADNFAVTIGNIKANLIFTPPEYTGIGQLGYYYSTNSGVTYNNTKIYTTPIVVNLIKGVYYDFALLPTNAYGNAVSASTVNYTISSNIFNIYNYKTPVSTNWGSITISYADSIQQYPFGNIGYVAPSTINSNIWISTDGSLSTWKEIKQFGTGFTWVNVSSSGTRALAAAGLSGNLWYSTSVGLSWTDTYLKGNWSEVYVSMYDDYAYALDKGGSIYFGKWTGTTIIWNKTVTTSNWSAIASYGENYGNIPFGNKWFGSNDGTIYSNLTITNGTNTTWSSSSTNGTWKSCAMNGYGNLAIAVRNGVSGAADGILFSTNSGVNWIVSIIDSWENYWPSCCMNYSGNVSIVVGLYIFYSLDGGNNWVLSNSPSLYWSDVAINYTGNIVIATSGRDGYSNDTGNIYFSTNNGINWRESNAPYTGINWTSCTINAIGNIAMAVTDTYDRGFIANTIIPGNGTVYYSTNGGNNWITSLSTTNMGWSTVKLNSSGNIALLSGVNTSGVLGWQSELYKSTDSGGNWVRYVNLLDTVSSISLNSTGNIAIITHAYIGHIWYYNDSNSNFLYKSVNVPSSGCSSSALNEIGNIALLTTPNESIYYTTNNINSPDIYGLNPVANSPTGNWVALTTNSYGNVVIALSLPGNIYVSTNSAQSWQNIRVDGIENRPWKDITYDPYADYYSDYGLFMAIENPGNVYYSSNNGINWNYISNLPYANWNSINCAEMYFDAWQGFMAVAGSGGNIYKIIPNQI